MKIEELDSPVIVSTLSAYGYERSQKNTFRASWSNSNVEHFVFLRLGAAPARASKNILSVGYGLVNQAAENFAIQCLCQFGGELYSQRRSKGMRIRDGYMMFQFLEDHRKWALSIYLPDVTLADVASILGRKLRDEFMPYAKQILSVDDLYNVLCGDSAPFGWSRIHAALRAGQIVSLGCQIGKSAGEILNALEPFASNISTGLGKDVAANPKLFIEKSISHWHEMK